MVGLDLPEQLGSLGDTIIENRDATEAERRLPQPVVDGIRSSRLNRMGLTEENRGLELTAVETLEIYEALASREASVAWVVWNNSLPCLFSRYLTPEVRSEIFGNPDWLYANSTRPTGRATVIPEGYRVSGRWSLVSGCELAEWMPLMCLVEEAGEVRMLAHGQPEMRFVFAHRSEVEIIDTWRVGGMRGTGSHDVAVNELVAPRGRSLSPMDRCTVEGPLARIPIVSLLGAGFAAQMIGAARSALDTAVRLGRSKLTPDPNPDMRDRPATQLAVADAKVALAAARRHLHETAREFWQTAESGQPFELPCIASMWLAAWHAHRTASRIVGKMFDVSGTSAIYSDCPLERVVRDVRTMQQHVLGQPTWAEDAGRVELGLRPSNPLFAI